MPYSTYEDIKTDLGISELTRLTNPGGDAPDETRVAQAINFADLTIDAAVGGRYSLPLAAENVGILRKISMDFAIYNLYSASYSKTSPPETVYLRKKESAALLAKVSAGDIALPAEAVRPPFIITNADCRKNYVCEEGRCGL